MDKRKHSVSIFCNDDSLINFSQSDFIDNYDLIFIGNDKEPLYSLLSDRPSCVVFKIDALTEQYEQIQNWCNQYFIPLIAIMDENSTVPLTDVFRTTSVVLSYPIEPQILHLCILKQIEKYNLFHTHSATDLVTNASSTFLLKEELNKQIYDMKRSHDAFSLVYVTAKIKHAQGDREITSTLEGSNLVKKLVHFLKDSIRPTDFLGHHRGNAEFVLILPKTRKVDAEKLINRLRNTLEGSAIQTEMVKVDFLAKAIEIVDATKTADEYLSDGCLNKELDESIEESVSLRKLKVAIIDDDRLIREMLTHQLEKIGEGEYELEIKAFPNGEDFFEDPWHKQNERYLLIIDRIMPKMDGLEVLGKIRSNYDRKRYTCIMLTSKSSEADISLAIQRGANDYITKPFSLTELRIRINRLLRGTA